MVRGEGGRAQPTFHPFSQLFPPPSRGGGTLFKASWSLSEQAPRIGFEKSAANPRDPIEPPVDGGSEGEAAAPFCCRSTLPSPPSKHFTPSYTFWSSERWRVSFEGREREGRRNTQRDGWGGRENSGMDGRCHEPSSLLFLIPSGRRYACMPKMVSSRPISLPAPLPSDSNVESRSVIAATAASLVSCMFVFAAPLCPRLGSN